MAVRVTARDAGRPVRERGPATMPFAMGARTRTFLLLVSAGASVASCLDLTMRRDAPDLRTPSAAYARPARVDRLLPLEVIVRHDPFARTRTAAAHAVRARIRSHTTPRFTHARHDAHAHGERRESTAARAIAAAGRVSLPNVARRPHVVSSSLRPPAWKMPLANRAAVSPDAYPGAPAPY